MSTTHSTADFLLDQLSGRGTVRARKMFGEYALYYNDTVVALIYDNQLYVKKTEGGAKLLREIIEAPPYAKAKPHFLIDESLWEDREFLSELIMRTWEEVRKAK
jgi:TfoX/Sxy family transcriptional regulator of competence genes